MFLDFWDLNLCASRNEIPFPRDKGEENKCLQIGQELASAYKTFLHELTCDNWHYPKVLRLYVASLDYLNLKGI